MELYIVVAAHSEGFDGTHSQGKDFFHYERIHTCPIIHVFWGSGEIFLAKKIE